MTSKNMGTHKVHCWVSTALIGFFGSCSIRQAGTMNVETRAAQDNRFNGCKSIIGGVGKQYPEYKKLFDTAVVTCALLKEFYPDQEQASNIMTRLMELVDKVVSALVDWPVDLSYSISTFFESSRICMSTQQVARFNPRHIITTYRNHPVVEAAVSCRHAYQYACFAIRSIQDGTSVRKDIIKEIIKSAEYSKAAIEKMIRLDEKSSSIEIVAFSIGVITEINALILKQLCNEKVSTLSNGNWIKIAYDALKDFSSDLTRSYKGIPSNTAIILIHKILKAHLDNHDPEKGSIPEPDIVKKIAGDQYFIRSEWLTKIINIANYVLVEGNKQIAASVKDLV
ncbi:MULTISPECIES: hypothetical protein [unclassified Candidatus Cardinium]|uniref:hypothetical protein n=1 Tax=unclassified Candidatus Cardinium TaxID=2641185 RepID=UPI001FB2E89D|nr:MULTISPECIES: hypothetical protein [unclassified Candidatus Cardinium]